MIFIIISYNDVVEQYTDLICTFPVAEIGDCSVDITEAAKQCGFSDPSALYRVFKKLVGVSPNQYRAQGMVNNAKQML